MSLETINSVDINFSNGAGGHTATVNSTVDVKNSDGSPSLGVVDGEIGSKNYFSKNEINNIMSRFICTSLTKNQGPIGLTVSRKYSDITSLTLKSYLVMVRGVNAPPDNSNSFEGMFPFFSEVKGSPLESYPSTSVREIEGKRILVVGKIYNYESVTVLNGLKVSLVYNDQKLKKNLCLNQDTVTQQYKDSPSLSNYTLKFGYTLDEYLEMLDHVGIVHKGLENVENGDTILFENSGTLADVTSAIAAYFGYYYFIDPNTGNLNFIDSRIASDIKITDFTKTTDENIVSATFTEDKFTPEIVNAYIGSADKPSINTEQGRFKFENGAGSDGGRDTRVNFFQLRNQDILIDSNKTQTLDPRILAAYYLYFALGLSNNKALFDIYTFALMLANFPFRKGLNDFAQLFKGGFQFNTAIYPHARLANFTKQKFCKDARSPTEVGVDTSFAVTGGLEQGNEVVNAQNWVNQNPEDGIADNHKVDAKINDLPQAFSRKYGLAEAANYPLTPIDVIEKGATITPNLEMPSDSDLYSFLEKYFKFAGSAYISSGMSEDKAARIAIEDNGLKLIGPFSKNDSIRDAINKDNESEEYFNWLIEYRGFTENTLISTLIGPAIFGKQDAGDFHYIVLNEFAISAPLPNVRGNREDVIKELKEKFLFLQKMSYINKGDGEKGKSSLVESRTPVVLNNGDIFSRVTNLARISTSGYERAIANADALNRKQIRLDATIFNKPVEQIGNDPDDDDNEQLVGDPVDNEKLQELLQRYDLKSFKFDAPKTDQYTPLSLVVANGSTIEVNALREATRKSYLDSPPKNLKSSSKTIYGLEIPSEFKITTSSFQIRVGSDGITTTIGESTLKLIPPTQEFIVNQAMETIGTPSINPRLRSTQRNYLGL
jgi:hypothetical protein